MTSPAPAAPTTKRVPLRCKTPQALPENPGLRRDVLPEKFKNSTGIGMHRAKVHGLHGIGHGDAPACPPAPGLHQPTRLPDALKCQFCHCTFARIDVLKRHVRSRCAAAFRAKASAPVNPAQVSPTAASDHVRPRAACRVEGGGRRQVVGQGNGVTAFAARGRASY